MPKRTKPLTFKLSLDMPLREGVSLAALTEFANDVKNGAAAYSDAPSVKANYPRVTGQSI